MTDELINLIVKEVLKQTNQKNENVCVSLDLITAAKIIHNDADVDRNFTHYKWNENIDNKYKKIYNEDLVKFGYINVEDTQMVIDKHPKVITEEYLKGNNIKSIDETNKIITPMARDYLNSVKRDIKE